MFTTQFNKKVFQQLVYLNHKIDVLTEENTKYERLRLDLRVASYELTSAINKLTDSASDSTDVNSAIASLRDLKTKLDNETIVLGVRELNLDAYDYVSE